MRRASRFAVLPLAWILVFWAIGGPITRPVRAEAAAEKQDAATEAAETKETATKEGTEKNEAATKGAAGQKSAAAQPKAKRPRGVDKKLEKWIKPVDKFFEERLVRPLGMVLFFPVYSTEVAQADGTMKKVQVPLVVVWLLGGAIFFTLRMRFINLRGFWHAIRLTKGDFDDPEDTGEVSHFQALASALSATVGLGNIAGVAIAIGQGGPGATFWMILIGLLGMSSKFTECSLGQLYRKVMPDGTVSGGPMRYLRDGLAEMNLAPLGRFLAVLFALLCIGGSLGGGNTFQVTQSLGVLRTEPTLRLLDAHPWIYGLVMVVLVGLVIIGGIKSIGAVAGRIVPVMCAAYVLAALYILFSHAAHIPAAFAMILKGAFTPDAVYGGFLGVMVMGVKRAVFSNEAGAGSAAIAHSAARTDEPISEGIVALLEPFIDTVVICTMTALVIVITGVYDPKGPNASLIAGDQGAALTSIAFQEGGFVWFKWILFAAVVLFAYSTMISWSYYGERCFTTLFGMRTSMFYKGLFLVFTFLGSIVNATSIRDFSDMLILGMSFPNILGVVLLSGKVKRELDRYWEKYKSGELERRVAKGKGKA